MYHMYLYCAVIGNCKMKITKIDLVFTSYIWGKNQKKMLIQDSFIDEGKQLCLNVSNSRNNKYVF